MGTPTAGLEGVIAGESEICYIDGYAGVLSYRGYNIHTLADHASFEETIFLLWYGWLPKQRELDQFSKQLAAERGVPPAGVDFLKSVPSSNTMDVLRTAVSMLGHGLVELGRGLAVGHDRHVLRRLAVEQQRPQRSLVRVCHRRQLLHLKRRLQ